MAIDIDSDAALETLEELFADVQNQLMAQTGSVFCARARARLRRAVQHPNPVRRVRHY